MAGGLSAQVTNMLRFNAVMDSCCTPSSSSLVFKLRSDWRYFSWIFGDPGWLELELAFGGCRENCGLGGGGAEVLLLLVAFCCCC